MTKTKEHAVSRRTFVKGSALAGLGTAALGTGTLFACSPQQEGSGGDAVSTEPVEEQIVWTHCAVNCGSTCALQCHVAGGEVQDIEHSAQAALKWISPSCAPACAAVRCVAGCRALIA